MLILTRQRNQSIHIGDDITITILRSNSNNVRIGIDAPPDVDVYRGEVYDRIVAERLQQESE